MSRTPARINQADVARAIRAAKQTGAGRVRLLPDGTIEIDIVQRAVENPDPLIEQNERVVL
jgi:hypothetical protein